jgi:hypothetical protein
MSAFGLSGSCDNPSKQITENIKKKMPQTLHVFDFDRKRVLCLNFSAFSLLFPLDVISFLSWFEYEFISPCILLTASSNEMNLSDVSPIK